MLRLLAGASRSMALRSSEAMAGSSPDPTRLHGEPPDQPDLTAASSAAVRAATRRITMDDLLPDTRPDLRTDVEAAAIPPLDGHALSLLSRSLDALVASNAAKQAHQQRQHEQFLEACRALLVSNRPTPESAAQPLLPLPQCRERGWQMPLLMPRCCPLKFKLR